MATSTKPSPAASKAAKKNGRTGAAKKKLSATKAEQSFWRDIAPKGVTGAPKGTSGNGAWAAWSAHLCNRKLPQTLVQLSQSVSTPLQWGIKLQELSPRTVELLAMLDQLAVETGHENLGVSEQTIEPIFAAWLEGSHALPQTIDFALECLVVAHALPQIAGIVLEGFWWELADALWQITTSASDWHSDAQLPPEQGIAQQMLAGELPLTMAYLLPEIQLIDKLRSPAREALTEGLAELTNGNGLVQGEYLGFQRPLLACWTRCRMMGDKLKKGSWSRKSDDVFEWAVTHALGLSSPRGTPLLGQPHDESWTPEFLRAAIKAGGDQADAAAAKSIFGKKLTAVIKGSTNDAVPETSDNCEWAGVAYMRNAWGRKSPVLAVDYSSPDLRLDCWVGQQQLITGVWAWETTLDGKRLEPVGSWDESCWFSDDDVDYIELSMELTEDARLERQILLARDERFLLLADYVLGTRGGEICHRYRVPLAASVEFQPEVETREGRLTAGKSVARVLPLALPEWRDDPRLGQLTYSNSSLQLEQKRSGQNLACPLLIDLKKSRANKPCTWRQLTVAQSLEIQTHDVAVGYRAQCGKDQWLVYRSLAKPANRTLLGKNLSNECLVARFLAPSGEIDELLEVE